MDPDVFPNTLEYWGPTGMVFFRNVQLRYTPILGTHTAMIALERPGASGDQGVYADRVELNGITPRFPMPDFSGAYKYTQKWGYLRAAGILRKINWDDTLEDRFNLSGDAIGWGLNLSSNLKPTASDTIRLQYAFGEGIQNYMNDSPVDVGIAPNLGDLRSPITGEAIPITGSVVFLDHNWNSQWSTSIGYSRQDNDNTEGQNDDAFETGQYALANVLYTPVKNVMMGGEVQWGRREMFRDPFVGKGLKLQFSFKYNFSATIGGQ
jgi:hypothetical protein